MSETDPEKEVVLTEKDPDLIVEKEAITSASTEVVITRIEDLTEVSVENIIEHQHHTENLQLK